MNTIYEVRDGNVVEINGEFYTDELEAYKALVKRIASANAKQSGARPFRHKCWVYFSDGRMHIFGSLRDAMRWLIGKRKWTDAEWQMYHSMTHCGKADKESGIRPLEMVRCEIVEQETGGTTECYEDDE